MGLDMYLTKKVFVGAEYEHSKITGTIEIFQNGKKMDVSLENLSELEYRQAYWRKENHIHNWFVSNIQDGLDECQSSYVCTSELKLLVELCKETLAIINNSKLIEKQIKDKFSKTISTIEVYDCSELIKEKLPTTSGFFFGSEEIDKWYKESLEYTIEALSNLDESAEYYYQASW